MPSTHDLPQMRRRKFVAKIEASGACSRSLPSFEVNKVLCEDAVLSVGNLRVLIEEHMEAGSQGEATQLVLLDHRIVDAHERIMPGKTPVLPPATGGHATNYWHSSFWKEFDSIAPPPYSVMVGNEGVAFGGMTVFWKDILSEASCEEGDRIQFYLDGILIDRELAVVIQSHPDEKIRNFAPALLAELDFMVKHGRLESGLSTADQIKREAITRPEVLLELAFSVHWEHARRMVGPLDLRRWLEANHP
jgi:hypothetical protein